MSGTFQAKTVPGQNKKKKPQVSMSQVSTHIPPKTQQVVMGQPVPAKNFAPKVNIKEVESLPSKGLTYPEGVRITYRPYLFGEVKSISGSKLSTKEAYDTILEGVDVAGMDKLDLTLPDVMYLGLLRKISTLGATEIIARHQCEECGTLNNIIFKNDEVEFDDIEAPKLPIEGDFSFGRVQFRPMTIGQYFELIDMNKAKDEVAMYAIQSNLEFKEAYETFYNAEPDDARLLIEIDKFLFHGVKAKIKPCVGKIKVGDKEAKCTANITIELDGGQAMLLPFRSSAEPLSSRIHFGVEGER